MKITREKLHDIFGIIFIAVGLIIFIGLVSNDSIGKLGALVQFLYSMTFGKYISFTIPLFLFIEGYFFIKMYSPLKHAKNFMSFFVFSFVISSFTAIYKSGGDLTYFSGISSSYGDSPGAVGFYSGRHLIELMGYIGSLIGLAALFLIVLLIIFDFRIVQMAKVLSFPFIQIVNAVRTFYITIRKFQERRKLEKEMKRKDSEEMITPGYSEPEDEKNYVNEEEQPSTEKDAQKEESDPEKDFNIEEAVIERSVDYKARVDKKYKYNPPGIDLLNESKVNANIIEDEQKLKETAAKLQEKLREFSLEAEVVKINPGPVLTQYEIELARGIKVSKVTSLEDDLAMALKAKSIRIVAPIPGKGTIGIEIPNSKPSIVYLKSIISSEKFIEHKSKLAIALGKMISGENYILDLTKTPHLLIAGSTGSGKSVCINGLIISILYRATPEEVQFCMIDPKKVELSVYSGLIKHHLLQIDGIDDPVVTKPEDAVRLLEALVTEMESRYEILQQSGTRNLEEYNSLVVSGELKLNEVTNEKYRKLPYIVCILDEYGDLMMTSGKAVEDPICRLAQMARAIGIHLVLATQRPSVKVVTGAIKANFPSRIAFRVISQIDSRTILDCKGAESLLGKGDMLLIPPGESDMVRIQNALVDTKEINKVVKHISAQPDNFDKISIKAKTSAAPTVSGYGSDEESGRAGSDDPKYNEAKALVVRTGMASVSMLQRGLSVGYARAGKLIDQLERDGVIGPHQGSKSREVLVSSADED
ncbi:MAG: DNA translocase FtsK [Candidatus Delongbacteria bacterium]